METVLNVLLIRFAIIAVVVAVAGLVLFAVVLRWKRRGRWERVRGRYGSVAARGLERYAGRPSVDSSLRGRAAAEAARRLRDDDATGRR